MPFFTTSDLHFSLSSIFTNDILIPITELFSVNVFYLVGNRSVVTTDFLLGSYQGPTLFSTQDPQEAASASVSTAESQSKQMGLPPNASAPSFPDSVADIKQVT